MDPVLFLQVCSSLQGNVSAESSIFKASSCHIVLARHVTVELAPTEDLDIYIELQFVPTYHYIL